LSPRLDAIVSKILYFLELISVSFFEDFCVWNRACVARAILLVRIRINPKRRPPCLCVTTFPRVIHKLANLKWMKYRWALSPSGEHYFVILFFVVYLYFIFLKFEHFLNQTFVKFIFLKKTWTFFKYWSLSKFDFFLKSEHFLDLFFINLIIF
jgi:hypothetical protein